MQAHRHQSHRLHQGSVLVSYSPIPDGAGRRQERRVKDFGLRVRRDALKRKVTWFVANDVTLLKSQNYLDFFKGTLSNVEGKWHS